MQLSYGILCAVPELNTYVFVSVCPRFLKLNTGELVCIHACRRGPRFLKLNTVVLVSRETLLCWCAYMRVGVAPGAKIRDYRVFDGKRCTRKGAVPQAIIDAAKDGCHVINLSLGGPRDMDDLVSGRSARFCTWKGGIVRT